MIDLRQGDCLEKMREMKDNSIDFILTDAPYELTAVQNFSKKNKEDNNNNNSKNGKGFMGKEWDGTGIAFDSNMWKEALRILKPNSYMFAFSGTRTYHRMAKAIEEAGFEIVGITNYVYGSGFPKALDISKAIDKKLGKEREVVGKRTDGRYKYAVNTTLTTYANEVGASAGFSGEKYGIITAPASDLAKQYEGYKTQLKPSKEPIIIARKKSDTPEQIKEFKPFFYCAKASKKDRNSDIYGNVVEGLNNHPTVKSTNLMQNLFKEVVSSEDMVVLDMFAGSGSTGVAIEKYNIENGTNHKCILIEREEEYAEIIKKRCCLEEV